MDFKSLMPFGRRELAEDPFTAMRREMDRMFEEMTKSFSLARPAFGMGLMAPRVDMRETDTASRFRPSCPGSPRRTSKSSSPTAC